MRIALILLGALLAPLTAFGAAGSHPQVRVGGFPTGIALNPLTHTVYVANGTSGSVSVFNGQTCNAGVSRGCGQHVSAVTAGIDPIGVAVDRSTNTLYIVNLSGTVAMVDGSRCDSANTSGCKVGPSTVTVGSNPQFLAVDDRTHTIYVANPNVNEVSVIDGRRLKLRAKISVGPLPFTLAVNDATSSLYVTDAGAKTVSVIDIGHCNAVDVSGCGRKPVSVNVGEVPGGIAVDTVTGTVYVTGESSDDVSVIDGIHCNARTTSGCRRTPLRILAGRGARGIAVNERTHTVYVANTNANTVSIIDGSRCNASETSGCPRKAAVAPVGISPRRVAVDVLTNTIYVTNAGSNSVTVIDGAKCNGKVHTGCRGTPVA